MGDFLDLFNRLDSDPRVRGRQFEYLCQWFLTNDPTYKAILRRVWLWDEWPGRWAADAGIDLVAEDSDGRIWAIQSKAYDAAYAVTKADVDKFLSESSRAVFSYRLLIATTDKLHRIARRTISDQEKQVAFVGLSDLLTSEVSWPTGTADLRPSTPQKPARPREHQREAIRNVVKGFTTSDRGQLIMACGTGKTLTSLFVKEKLSAERTLVLVPSLSLLKQTMQVWTVNSKVPFEALPVCSDQTVGRSDDDAAIAHASELGVPVTTDAHEIATFLRRRSGPRVVFSTYQSSAKIAAAFALGRAPAFDLVIADEAHRIAGPVSSDFATVLEDSAIKARRRLYMTATPRYFTGRVVRAAKEADFELASMDNVKKFGTTFHRLTFGEAIKRDLLTDYRVVIVGVDDATYKDWAERGTLVTRDGEKLTDARTLAGQIGLAKAIRKYDLHRTISFHSRVARAREFAAEVPEVIEWMPTRQRPTGALWSSYASGEMSAGERHVRLQHLSRLDEGQRGLLTNARCLSEGVDVPTLDGIAFIDPRRSEVDIVQAVGRAIRKSDDKNVGTIVIPVFIDTTTDPETALDSSAFKPVWDVIQALRAHDGELGEQLDALRRELGRQGGHPRLPDKIHTDIPARVGIDFARAFDVRLVEQSTQPWEFWLGLLERYATERGTALVRGSEIFEGHRLGQWVIIQRTKWEILTEDRRQRLSSLPGWTTDVRETQWQEGFEHLEGYVALSGDARVRDDYVDADGYRLGKWVGKQRTKWDKLTEDQRDRLERLPGWTQDARAANWENGFDLLRRYAVETGATCPPRDFECDRFKLGIWVRTQRRNWDHLTEDRRSRLSRLPGWMVDPLIEQWEQSFLLLQEYVAEHGDAQVPQAVVYQGEPLGRWVSKQRDRWDLLSDEQRRRLERFPGWTLDARGVWWDEGFGHLQDYVAEHGTALLRQNTRYNGFALGPWVSNQKTRWDTLSEDRQQRLEALPGWTTDDRSARWELGYGHLLDYVEEFGTSRLPSSRYVHNDFSLGSWVNNQRHKWSTLSEERRDRLTALPEWTVNTRETAWDQGFDYLCRYVEQEGDALVSSRCIFQDFPLGQWVTTQRSHWKKLDDTRKKRLMDLPGWVISVQAARWEEGFRRLAAYADEHANAMPAQSHVDTDGNRPGVWAQTQRQHHSRGELDPARATRLESLPGWDWTPNETRWEDSFCRLRAYADRNGHASPPQQYKDLDGYSLGTWVNLQRQLKEKGTLRPEFLDRLQTLPGWQWNPRAALWEEGLSRLQEYVTTNGHACPPATYITDDGYRLGTWVSQQRSKRNRGLLSPDRYERLSDVSGWEWIRPKGSAARRR
ncbi:Helicase associated domain protein [Gordonia sp. NPDC057258]|uniref:DEAD/DEAH box helicase n=1 Tax=unclassified Gordonia (in: high G+C Gram-positive bacteria) TaxID=2657482 RepID=UPI00363A11C7